MTKLCLMCRDLHRHGEETFVVSFKVRLEERLQLVCASHLFLPLLYRRSYPEYLHYLIAQVVDHLDGDPPGFGLGERP